jgi:hypothetical protein
MLIGMIERTDIGMSVHHEQDQRRPAESQALPHGIRPARRGLHR